MSYICYNYDRYCPEGEYICCCDCNFRIDCEDACSEADVVEYCSEAEEL